jgi:hypothetical protein
LITLPVIIELQDWADQIVLDLDTYGPIPRLVDKDQWQDWAVSFCVISGISQKNPPNPYYFSDWREWASRFAQVMD